MNTIKICAQCQHYQPRYAQQPVCGHPEAIDPVTGTEQRTCGDVRSAFGGCGPDGRWFEPKARERTAE